MGGGDLNLKKSWHPNTMKNQERVWKAEQADAAEKQKLAELQREISDERDREQLKRVGQMSGVLAAPDSNKKLEWMYKSSGDLLNREEYLLGRSIDKNFERVEAEEQQALVGVQVHKNHVEHECIPFSIRSYHGVQMSDEQVDLQRKIMEDPLMAIRQREMETRRKLLENPVKLKEIHRLLRNDADLDGKSKRSKDKKSAKKKDKKSKKSSKNGAHDLDKLLAKKYRKIRKETLEDEDNGNVDIDKFLTMKYRQLSNELDKMGGKSRKSKNKKSKDDFDKRERSRDRHLTDGRERSVPSRDRGSVADSSRDKKSRYYSDNNTHQRNHSTSPDHTRRDRKASPQKRNQRSRSPDHARRVRKPSPPKRNHRSRSVSPSRRVERSDRNRYNDREPYYRSSSQDRVHRNRQEDRNERNKKSASKDRDRNRRELSRDREGRSRRSRSEEGNRRKRRSPSKDRLRKSRSRSRSHNTKTKYQSSTSRRKSRSKSRQDDKKVRIPARNTAQATKSTRSPSTTSSRSSSSSSSSDSSESEEKPTINYGLVTADGKKIEIKNKYQPVERRDIGKVTSKKMSHAQPKRVPLTDEERERKLLEMQANARIRVIECQQIMERNKKEKLAEEALSQTFDKDYVNKEMRKAIANQFSVESRIKSNMNNIQRSGRTMEANFAKR